MQKLIKVTLLFCLIPVTNFLFAAEESELSIVQKRIKANVPSMNIEAISKSKMPGIYEVLASGQLLYITEDGKYLFSGKLFSIYDGIKDLTAESMEIIDMKIAPMRRDKVSAVSKSDMVIFKAADEKHRVTVFTDVDCGYCRKLHREMENYNKLGITVQYMGFPRAGLGSNSHRKLQTIWCAKDPLEAMNKAKNKMEFGSDSCDDPLAEHYKVVEELGLTGTPAIILESGRLIGGYVDAKQLLTTIKHDEMELAGAVNTAE